MSQQTIESHDLTIAKLFDDFYQIPNYQREYVWQVEQVEQFLTDIHTEFPQTNQKDKSDDYFIGSIVVCSGLEDTDALYEVIDGQQRITTIYIFFCAIRNYILSLGTDKRVNNIEKYISGDDTDSDGYSVSRCKVKLQYDDRSNILKKFDDKDFDPSRVNFNLESESIKNLVNCYETITDFLKSEFDKNEDEIRRFYAHFIKKS